MELCKKVEPVGVALVFGVLAVLTVLEAGEVAYTNCLPECTQLVHTSTGKTEDDCTPINIKEDCCLEETLEDERNSSVIKTDKSYNDGVLNITVHLRRIPALLELRTDSLNYCHHVPLMPRKALGGVVTITNLREASYSPSYTTVRAVVHQCPNRDLPLLSSQMSCQEYYYNKETYYFHKIDSKSFSISWRHTENKNFNLTNISFSLCSNSVNISCLPININAQEKTFVNMETGNYYFKVDCGVCYYESKDFFFNGSGAHFSSVYIEVADKDDSILVIMIASALIIIVTGVFFITRYIVSRRSERQSQNQDYSILTSEDARPVLPTDVLLLYSYDSGVFDDVINALKNLLEKMDLKVLDPLEESLQEDVARNPSGWLLQQLNSSSTKIVLVLTHGAMMRQKALLKNRILHFCHPHPRDGIFTYALQYLHENPRLSRDYKRVFAVRFSDISSQEHFLPLIVPLRCYALIDHLSQFHHDINGYHTRPTALENYHSEIEDLKRSVNEVKVFMEANPSWLSDLYLE